MNKLKIVIIFSILSFLISGCSSKKVVTKFVKVGNSEVQKFNRTNNYNKFRYKPVIGTRQEDTKVMIDMGQYAKIWIKNYRNKNETFVASHDIITMIKSPGFISGEDVPSSRRRTVNKTYSGNSFSYRSSDLIHNSNTMDKLKIKHVKDYVNNYNQVKKYKKLPISKQKIVNKYDKKIKSYLKAKRNKDKK